ncbi:MAG TPA: hypothetical protein VHX61_03445 [Rhizomicrobium sp.]|jgi:hypothetical protein|nr:hypothetical protein [Rhizomicrobium sp.]
MGATEQIVQSIFQLFAVILQTIIPKGRMAASGLIALLILAAALGSLFVEHTTRFLFWDKAALYWYYYASTQIAVLGVSLVVTVGCLLGRGSTSRISIRAERGRSFTSSRAFVGPEFWLGFGSPGRKKTPRNFIPPSRSCCTPSSQISMRR